MNLCHLHSDSHSTGLMATQILRNSIGSSKQVLDPKTYHVLLNLQFKMMQEDSYLAVMWNEAS
jgi:hypothetical protein